MAEPVRTHPAPYYAVISTSIRTEGDNGYRVTAEKMLVLDAMGHLINVKTRRMTDAL